MKSARVMCGILVPFIVAGLSGAGAGAEVNTAEHQVLADGFFKMPSENGIEVGLSATKIY